MPPEMPTPTANAPAAGGVPGAGPSASAIATPSAAYRYAWVFLVGILGYLAISAVLLSAYVITEGRGFFVPMQWPTLSFVRLFAAPTFLASFLPFAAVHAVATVFRMRITTRSAALAGAAMGALGGWAICGKGAQSCFSPFGAFPLLGWYIVACCMLTAVFYQRNARKNGF